MITLVTLNNKNSPGLWCSEIDGIIPVTEVNLSSLSVGGLTQKVLSFIVNDQDVTNLFEKKIKKSYLIFSDTYYVPKDALDGRTEYNYVRMSSKKRITNSLNDLNKIIIKSENDKNYSSKQVLAHFSHAELRNYPERNYSIVMLYYNRIFDYFTYFHYDKNPINHIIVSPSSMKNETRCNEGILCTEYMGMIKINNVTLGADIESFTYNVTFDIYNSEDADKFISAINLMITLLNALGYKTTSGNILPSSSDCVRSYTTNVTLNFPMYVFTNDKQLVRLVNYIGLQTLTGINFFKENLNLYMDNLCNISITKDVDDLSVSSLTRQSIYVNKSAAIQCKLSYLNVRRASSEA